MSVERFPAIGSSTGLLVLRLRVYIVLVASSDTGTGIKRKLEHHFFESVDDAKFACQWAMSNFIEDLEKIPTVTDIKIESDDPPLQIETYIVRWKFGETSCSRWFYVNCDVLERQVVGKQSVTASPVGLPLWDRL